MDKEIKVTVVGLGMRGSDNLRLLLRLGGIRVVCVCDKYEDRCEMGVKTVTEAGQPAPYATVDYKEAVARDCDAVMIFAAWEAHVPVAVAAMEAGHAVGMEVGGAMSLDECWQMVEVQERTGVPFMLLENCCYGKYEMLVRNLVRDGIFGDIVYCHGAYAHDLRKEVTEGKENRHYRLWHYTNRNGENYPTHELGPIAKILDINRGNRMVRLVSMASRASGLKAYIEEKGDALPNTELRTTDFRQGDIVDTLITCENGETISLRLDTTLPRSYSREFTVRGTRGMYEENTNSIFLDGDEEDFNPHIYYKAAFGNADRYSDTHLPDYWRRITEEELRAGHGGMDAFMFTAFFDALRTGKPMPIDVYDAAAWMAITVLSEMSIAGGNVPVEIPDFTKGAYKRRPRLDV